jgi:uncharacterized membrane protein
MTARLRTAAIACAVLGLAIAGYLTYVHYAGVAVLCVSGGGCETVQLSPYATLVGVPVAVLGLAGYLTILASLALHSDAGRLTAAAAALSGFGFSAYLTYRELFTIHAICQWCVASAVLMTTLAVLTSWRLLRIGAADVSPQPS